MRMLLSCLLAKHIHLSIVVTSHIEPMHSETQAVFFNFFGNMHHIDAPKTWFKEKQLLL